MKKTICALGFLAIAVTAAPAAADEYWTVDSGLYISGRASVQSVQASNATALGNDQWEYDTGFGVIAAVGYAFVFPEYGVSLRGEIEGSYRLAENTDVYFANGYYWDVVDGDTIYRSGMVNILIDVHTQTRFAPYFGAGIGRTLLRFNNWIVDVYDGTGAYIGRAVYPERDYDISVWQAIAGVGFHLSPGLAVELEYRFFQPNDPGFNGYISNEVSLGVRMIF